MKGTPGYFAPEIFDPLTPTAQLDARRLDVYAAGIVFYNLLVPTRSFAFHGGSPEEVLKRNSLGHVGRARMDAR